MTITILQQCTCCTATSQQLSTINTPCTKCHIGTMKIVTTTKHDQI